MPPRDRCYDCFRPTEHCLCRWIEPVDNRTGILVLQHPKERGHAFNTVRLARLALKRSEVIAGYVPDLARDAELPSRLDGAGLLYPGPGSRDMSALTPAERPERLVVLDGTWWHARTMLRDVPALGRLPRFALPGGLTSGFRIRKQPAQGCLSTLEAVAAALRLLEPDTPGLDGLLRPFEEMQRMHLGATTSSTPRTRVRPRPRRRALPEALTERRRSLVVVYAEVHPEIVSGARRPLVALAASRPATEESWSAVLPAALQIEEAWPELALARGQVASEEALRARWRAFLRPGDVVAAWNASTFGALADQLGPLPETLELRPVYRSWRPHRGDLDSIIAAEGLGAGAPRAETRAETRRWNAEQVIDLLRSAAAPS